MLYLYARYLCSLARATIGYLVYNAIDEVPSNENRDLRIKWGVHPTFFVKLVFDRLTRTHEQTFVGIPNPHRCRRCARIMAYNLYQNHNHICSIFGPIILNHPYSRFVCKIPLLHARARPSARATIGYLVYKFSIFAELISLKSK